MEKASSRLKILALLVAVMFATLSIRLWFLQVLATEQFRKDAQHNGTRIVETDALRGNILWSDAKTELVDNRLSLEVRVNKQELGDDAESVLLHLSEILDIPVKTIRERLDDVRYFEFQPKPVAEFVKPPAAFYIQEHPEVFPGVQVVKASVRSYPSGRTAAHMLGYLGQIDAQELQDPRFKSYGQNDLVGKAGLEQTYEKYLRGTKGKQKFIVNSDGESLRALGSQPATPGDNLVLSLHRDIQTAAEQELYRGLQEARTQIDDAGGRGLYLKADAGAAIVMDVQTGGVLAMASWPTYDPSWYVTGLTDDQNRYLNESKQAPSLNRAVQQNYKPGSTFKPLVALAAVKEGVATLSGYYPCPATFTHAGDESGASFANWSSFDLPPLSIADSLRTSCDTVYYGFGDTFWNRWRENPLGTDNEPFQRDLRQWGFQQPTGIDLPGEASGVIPDAQFALDHKDVYPFGWVPGGDILLAIGSGDTLVTPLQMATAYSAIANGGHICRPHIVDRIVDPEGATVKTVGGGCTTQLPYSGPQLDYVRNALSSVTAAGTAQYAFAGFPLSSIPVAGKTGTAERDGEQFQSTSWFASFAPADHPKYAVVVMVEEGGYGSQTAAPIARHIYERIFGLDVTGSIDGGAQD